MSNPANQRAAARQARDLLARRLPGSRRGTVPAHLARAEHIADVIWRRWQVGPHRWRLKHVRWYLTEMPRSCAHSTRYRHWLTLRALILSLGHGNDWLGRLDGPWVRPTGRRGQLKTGRPMHKPGTGPGRGA